MPFCEKTAESVCGIVGEPAAKSAPVVAGIPTTSLQQFESTSHDRNVLSFVFEIDPHKADLLEAIRGRVMAGVTICYSSIFCEMALSAARFAHQTLESKTRLPARTISDLAITHPLVI